MSRQSSLSVIAALAGIVVTLAGGCSPADPDPVATEEALAPTNRIAIPAAVRRNLGITFANVEARAVRRTLRIPGRFELLPDARHVYRLPLAGRVTILVDQLAPVAAGDPLYELTATEWRVLLESMSETEAAINKAETRLASFRPLREAHEAHENELRDVIAISEERVAQQEQIAAAGGGRREQLIEARADLATARAALTETLEKEAMLVADEAAVRADLLALTARQQLHLASAAAISGMTPAELQAPGP